MGEKVSLSLGCLLYVLQISVAEISFGRRLAASLRGTARAAGSGAKTAFCATLWIRICVVFESLNVGSAYGLQVNEELTLALLSNRWFNQLDPNLNKRPFSEEEDCVVRALSLLCSFFNNFSLFFR
jgi:hypothetical protein